MARDSALHPPLYRATRAGLALRTRCFCCSHARHRDLPGKAVLPHRSKQSRTTYATIATVRDASYRDTPSDTKPTVNMRPAVVPVARVPVGLNPVPKVTVRLELPDVRISTERHEPAAGTVVVNVALAATVIFTTVFVPRAKAGPAGVA